MDDQRTNPERGGMKRFSIRELLLVAVIVALALGWWLDKRPVPSRFAIGCGAGDAYILDTATGQVWEKSRRLADGIVLNESTGFETPKVPAK